MLVRRADEMEGTDVPLDGAEKVQMRMMVGRADGAPNFSMRHFTVAPGGHTPRHSHNYEHEVYVLAGSARVEHDGEFIEVGGGDVLLVEPNSLHQFVNTSDDQSFQFLCFVPTEFDCSVDGRSPTPGS